MHLTIRLFTVGGRPGLLMDDDSGDRIAYAIVTIFVTERVWRGARDSVGFAPLFI